MSTIIAQGTARNITGRKHDDEIVPIPDERRFVTFVNDIGAIHTIIVDVEHAARDAEELLKWFDHTRTSVTHRSRSPETSSRHLSAEDVLKMADEALGFADRATQDHARETSTGSGEGQ